MYKKVPIAGEAYNPLAERQAHALLNLLYVTPEEALVTRIYVLRLNGFDATAHCLSSYLLFVDQAITCVISTGGSTYVLRDGRDKTGLKAAVSCIRVIGGREADVGLIV